MTYKKGKKLSIGGEEGEGTPEGFPNVEWFKASCMFMSWRDVILVNFSV